MLTCSIGREVCCTVVFSKLLAAFFKGFGTKETRYGGISGVSMFRNTHDKVWMNSEIVRELHATSKQFDVAWSSLNPSEFLANDDFEVRFLILWGSWDWRAWTRLEEYYKTTISHLRMSQICLGLFDNKKLGSWVQGLCRSDLLELVQDVQQKSSLLIARYTTRWLRLISIVCLELDSLKLSEILVNLQHGLRFVFFFLHNFSWTISSLQLVWLRFLAFSRPSCTPSCIWTARKCP